MFYASPRQNRVRMTTAVLSMKTLLGVAGLRRASANAAIGLARKILGCNWSPDILPTSARSHQSGGPASRLSRRFLAARLARTFHSQPLSKNLPNPLKHLPPILHDPPPPPCYPPPRGTLPSPAGRRRARLPFYFSRSLLKSPANPVCYTRD